MRLLLWRCCGTNASLTLLPHSTLFVFYVKTTPILVGAKGAVEILYGGKDVEEHTKEYTSRFANPMVAAQRGFVDGIIDPQATRKVICQDLRVLRNKKLDNIPRKHSNIPL
jgi:propionyl-CoA carboxylase beta chain